MLNLQKNYLQKYQQIYPENAEWNAIEYKLQLNLGNASVELKRVYNVMNPYHSNVFEKENKGSIVSEVYIKPDSLYGTNRIERVCQKGFEFNSHNGQNGMIFTMGQIEGINPNNKSEQELLVVKICPKKSFPVVGGPQNMHDDYPIPEGFDSVYYKEREDEHQIYRHKFKINNKIQTLPCYLVQFCFTNVHQKKFKKMICQKCQDLEATHFCLTEKTYFCKKCDYQHHNDKISARHDRKPLSQKPILHFGYCKDHPDLKNELFCKECNQSMCINCKIYGTHASGPMATHELKKIADYFEETASKINEMDPNLEKRKDQFEDLLNGVDKMIKDVNRKTAQIQEELRTMFEEALKDLEYISRRKLSLLISDQLQIRRQYDYIQWMESFLKYEFNVLPPNNFLASWTKHLKLRKDVLNINNIPAPTDVKRNFGVYGRARVIEGDRINWEDDRFSMTNRVERDNNLPGGNSGGPVQAGDRDEDPPRQGGSQFRNRLWNGVQ